MTLNYRAGAGANFSTGGSPTFPNPGGRQAGDLFVAILATKPNTMTTSGGVFHTFGDTIEDRAILNMKHIVKVGIDPGTIGIGSWSSMTMSYTSGGGQPGGQVTASFYKTEAEASYDYDWVLADDIDETGTGISCTGESLLEVAAGDYLLFIGVGNDDYTLSGTTFSVPGCTLGTPVEVNPTKTTTLLGDLAMHVFAIPVTAGSATGVPSMTATGSVSGRSGMAATFLRVREVLANGYVGWGVPL